MVSVGCRPDVVTVGCLITGFCRTDGLCKYGLVDKAKELFSEMKSKAVNPNVITYNTLIYGLCNTSNWEEAKTLFAEMSDEGVKPDEVTFTVVMDELCKNGKIDEANGLLQLMINRGGLALRAAD
ncbi:pentatricopeptide repeat-containing protein At1g62670, mitochondrial-like isoform X3 [Mangifera indica]|uniref:pentatricopeptide repeat-containing protein At1g62670, mitochondrial-like isoform X3 n=1 Tax=Mangifera indica TaxID=29780 RepID=UPI001CF99C9B|nr:pentatricopeptide repeat-containing protein At1g62670, mitochondrial-like isoform X3 [Mangifera indica]